MDFNHFAHIGMGDIPAYLKLAIKPRNSAPHFLCVLLYRPHHVGFLLHRQRLCVTWCRAYVRTGFGGFGQRQSGWKINGFLVVSFFFVILQSLKRWYVPHLFGWYNYENWRNIPCWKAWWWQLACLGYKLKDKSSLIIPDFLQHRHELETAKFLFF